MYAWKWTMLAWPVLLVTGCATPEYQQAALTSGESRIGYADREQETGVHVVEYLQYRGRDYDIELHKKYWMRRAVELCPFGYDGGLEIIEPAAGRIREFDCAGGRCDGYALVSGVIRCIEAT